MQSNQNPISFFGGSAGDPMKTAGHVWKRREMEDGILGSSGNGGLGQFSFPMLLSFTLSFLEEGQGLGDRRIFPHRPFLLPPRSSPLSTSSLF
uniref:Uncharacterized protein n=1 Tax=Nelumbo nucifera TaxID=4432 RepID=A0A822YG27_NELNU|nr:TPA_asm: hypothetical protein HUJ06_010361 [Nelumbo nucifera]